MLTEKTATPSEITAASRRGWTRWLIPRPFDLVSSLLYFGVLVPFLYNFITRSGYTPLISWWKIVLMLGSIVLLLGVDRLEFSLYEVKTPARIAVLLLLTRIVLIEMLCWLDQFKYSPFLYLIVLFLGSLYFGNAAGYGLGLLAWVVYIGKHFWANPGWLNNGTELHYLVLFTLGCIFAITIARVVIRERASRIRAEELLAELGHSHQQLQEYAEQVAELATTRERNRLAREIHDSLGHYLTVINVQLEKALTFREKRPLEAERAVSNAKRLASEALQDVRSSVSALRTTNELATFVPSITELVGHVWSEQCPIMLHIEGDETYCSGQSLLTLYRAVQEGLTNIQKHAAASQIWVDLSLGEREAALVVRDNGRGFDATNAQKEESEQGYGLRGVQERLEFVGGSLKVESAPGQGTTLVVQIPGNEYRQNDHGREEKK